MPVIFKNSPKGITAAKLNKAFKDAGSGGGGGGTPASGVFIWGETPTGAVNGANKNFTTVNTYAVGQLMVYLNGIRQRKPDDYSETSSTTFQFVGTPLTGDIVTVDYMKQ